MRNVFSNILAITLFIPALCLAQVKDIDSIKISNNSNTPISLKGNNSECIGQVEPHTINIIYQKDFKKLCKETHCSVAIYPNYTCSGSEEYAFDFHLSYGVGVFYSVFPNYVKAEGFLNNIFIMNK